jgi:hypothetical protein
MKNIPKKKKSARTRQNLHAKKAVADVEKLLKAQKNLELELTKLKKNLTRDMMTWQWNW